MDMFEHYYPDSEDTAYAQMQMEEEGRDIIWAVHDFADCCDKHGFLEMMRLLTDELQKRKRSNKE